MVVHSPLHHEDELTEATDEREEVGVGGLPSESQLVLLCLDYLRDLRRAYPEQDLATAEGLDADHLSVAIYALSRCFIRPSHIQVYSDSGNDAWLDRAKANILEPGTFPPIRKTSQSKKVVIPDLPTINKEILYKRNPDEIPENYGSDVGVPHNAEEDRYSWYEYDDAHMSNSHRFYPLNGLASGPTLRGSLTLGEVTAAGLAGLGARSRLDAEREMVKSPLFEQFLGAVRSKGFFRDPETEVPKEDPAEEKARQQLAAEIYEDRFRKVVAKFRTKLATKAQQQEGAASPVSIGGPLSGNLLALSAAERQTRRRQTRIHSARLKGGARFAAPSRASRVPDLAQVPSVDTMGISVVSSLTKKLAPRSPTERHVHGGQSAADLEEAEGLKSRGNVHMQKKEYQDAALAYTAALKLSPAGPQSHVYFSNRAAALLSMKRFNDAILDSERSLALKPDYGKAHARLGLAHFLLGNYRQAMEAYTVSLKYDPDNKSSRNYLEKATKRLTTQEQQQGDGHFASSFSVVSEWDRSETNRSVKSAAVSVSSLEDQQEKKKLIDQREAEKHKAKGNSYMASRDYVSAMDCYSKALQLCPSGPNSHVYFSNRAAALCYLERYEDAEADSERSLSLNPTYGKAHARLGLSRFFMGDYKGAVEAYSAALKFDPNNAASKSYLAKARARLDAVAGQGSSRKDTSSQTRALDQGNVSSAQNRSAEESLAAFIESGEITEEATTRLMDDPDLQRMAKKAMADPSMVETVMAAMKRQG